VVSVIRICGTSSLRAFVGRANEAPGEAENELLSCVSDATAELFNNGGISRVPGRPRLLEVMVWEEVDPCTKETSYKLGTLREAIREGAWSEHEGEWALDEKSPGLDIPNLSLNKGIKRRGPGWFWAAAILGIVMQGGKFYDYAPSSQVINTWYRDVPINHVVRHTCIRSHDCILVYRPFQK
jgi:hypothetical protein